MQSSTRFISFIVFLLTLGLFVCAKPVDSSALADRDADLLARNGGGGCTAGCNEADVLSVLVTLKASIDVYVGQLNTLSGNGGDPTGCIQAIIVAINVCVAALVKITPDLSGIHGDKCADIVSIVVEILVSIVVALCAFPITVVLKICINLQLDVCLQGLLLTLESVIAGLIALIAKALTNIDLFIKLQLTLTLTTCGLLGLL